MPILYEPAAPIGDGVTIYNRLAAQQRRAAAAASSAGGYGAPSYGGRAPRYGGGGDDIQSAIFQRDQMQFLRDKDSLDRTSVPASQVYAATAAASQQQQNFQLQANLQAVELSQQEKMRLQRMKNAIGEVEADGSLSAQEKNDLIMQLKTGIDPLQHRLAAQRVQIEQMQKEEMVKQYQMRAALDEQKLKVHTAKFEDRMTYFVDPSVMSGIIADFKASLPMSELIPPQQLEEMARQEAIRQGLGRPMFQQEPGKWTSVDELFPPAGKDKGPTHPSGLSPMDYLAAREKAETQAHREQQLTTEGDIPGTKKPVHPQTIEWKNERTRQIMQSLGLPMDMNEYNKGMTQQQGKGVYKSPFGQTPPGAAPPPGQTPPPGAAPPPPAVAQAEIGRDKQFIQTATGITEDERLAATFLLAETEKIMQKYPNPKDLPAEERRKLVEYSENLKKITAKAKPPVAAAAAPPAAAPAPGPNPAQFQGSGWMGLPGNPAELSTMMQSGYRGIVDSAPWNARRKRMGGN